MSALRCCAITVCDYNGLCPRGSTQCFEVFFIQTDELLHMKMVWSDELFKFDLFSVVRIFVPAS